MQKEIDSAVQFICGLLRARSLSLNLIEAFSTVLCEVMCKRYSGHWFPDKPSKGSAFRCMRIHDHIIDPLILEAGKKAGLSSVQLLKLLPNQLTVWVDPKEVAYRIGEDGSIGIIYEESTTSDLDDDISSSGIESGSSSAKTSPSQSPVPTSTDEEADSCHSISSTSSCRVEERGSSKASASHCNGQYLNSTLVVASS